MKILLIGNIGAGKTSIGSILADELKLPLVAMDDLRFRYSNGTIPGEYSALYQFMLACNDQNGCILEFSGVGCHKHSVKKALEDSKKSVSVVTILSEIDVIKKRLKDKKWPPHPWSLDLDNALLKIEKELKQDLDSRFWENTLLNHKVVILKNNQENNFDEIIKIIKQQLK